MKKWEETRGSLSLLWERQQLRWASHTSRGLVIMDNSETRFSFLISTTVTCRNCPRESKRSLVASQWIGGKKALGVRRLALQVRSSNNKAEIWQTARHVRSLFRKYPVGSAEADKAK